ncbi:MAG TPA: class I SAM-dependent methyltransferase [Tepidisphaeraceae bacterium]|jgi:demethylmenaquinone methyltransferase/2-methoxy-6-polyprenyl-1,4-benzoquinol methylase
MQKSVPVDVLEEMIAYYRQRAAEYDEWWDRRGRYDRGEVCNKQWFDERAAVFAAFDAVPLTDHVLELAPGTGIWTQRLVNKAAKITAVDASEEMIAINRARIASPKVNYLVADLFQWEPTETYDGVVFAFWVSHVPVERLEGFFATVARALRPGGRVFFVDGLREATSTAANHVLPEEREQVMVRKLNDERAFRIVKNFYAPQELISVCRRVGLQVSVSTTGSYFYFGQGVRT